MGQFFPYPDDLPRLYPYLPCLGIFPFGILERERYCPFKNRIIIFRSGTFLPENGFCIRRDGDSHLRMGENIHLCTDSFPLRFVWENLSGYMEKNAIMAQIFPLGILYIPRTASYLLSTAEKRGRFYLFSILGHNL